MNVLIVDFGEELRTLSSAVVGGGLAHARAWLNAQVPHDYARTDPDEHLRELVDRLRLPQPTIGMLTAADVGRATRHERASARVTATVGIGQPLAAAGRLPRRVPSVGTINVLVMSDADLGDAALVAAVQTATEAKAQALADARIPALNHTGNATGTATDSIVIACPTGGTTRFAGPATTAGADIAQAVHAAVLEGAREAVAWSRRSAS
jgi:adenosylcobinamide amidohydrolase